MVRPKWRSGDARLTSPLHLWMQIMTSTPTLARWTRACLYPYSSAVKEIPLAYDLTWCFASPHGHVPSVFHTLLKIYQICTWTWLFTLTQDTLSWLLFLQDRRYADLTEDQLPTCESLKDTIARALPFWNEEIVPQIKDGKRVLIAAHGNSLRGIVKHLEGKNPQDVCHLLHQLLLLE